MFFIMGISDGRKNFAFHQQMICDVCGRYGRYQVFMTYTFLSLFFIPCLKWNRHYYVQTSCCGTVYELDPEIGKRIAGGEQVEIMPQNMSRMQSTKWSNPYKRCGNCGFETAEDFDYCPKCGSKL